MLAAWWGCRARGVDCAYGVGVAGRGLAHVVCTLVRVERVVLLQSRASVPLPFRPLPDTELLLLPCVPSECLPFFSACLFLWACGVWLPFRV